jgi:cytosine/adenosine deaminase-related metal-dependent hydrolase
MDGARSVISDGAVAVTGTQIAAVGDRASLAREWTAERTIDLPEGIVMPGLINCHAHSLQTLLRGGIGPGRELYDWLMNVMYPGLAACGRVDAEVAAATFAAEAIRSGTTTVVDNGDAGLELDIAEGTIAGLRRIGIRSVYCPLWIEFVPDDVRDVLARYWAGDGSPPADAMGATETTATALARIAELRARHDCGKAGLLQIGIGPALPQTTSPDGLQAAAEAAKDHQALLTIHVAQAEVDARVRGRSAIEDLDELGILSPRLLAAHCVWLSASDAELMAERGACVAHNPTSNLFLSAGIAPTAMFRERGVTVGLGTDDANSNNAADVFAEMKLAGLLQRIRGAGDPRPAVDIFAMATIDAARAIGLDGVIGSLEPGKEADLVVVDSGLPELAPVHDVYETLVFQHAAQAVHTVIVGGAVVMAERALTALDAIEQRELAAEAQRRSAEIVGRAGLDRLQVTPTANDR